MSDMSPQEAIEPGSGDRILVFVPCYNCERQVPRVLAQIPALRAAVAEVLVLDNGSTDGTVKAAIEAAGEIANAPVVVARNRANYNLGGSHKAAFHYAAKRSFTHVVVLHGDDQADVRDILPLLESGAYREYDACLGSRFMKGARLIGYSNMRTVGNRAFNALFSFATLSAVRDLGSGLNIFSTSVFRDPDITRLADDLRFNIYLLLHMIDTRRRLLYFPISWREEDQRSNVELLSQSARTGTLLAEYVLHRSRFRRRDHRRKAIEAYQFEVVTDPESRAGSEL